MLIVIGGKTLSYIVPGESVMRPELHPKSTGVETVVTNGGNKEAIETLISNGLMPHKTHIIEHAQFCLDKRTPTSKTTVTLLNMFALTNHVPCHVILLCRNTDEIDKLILHLADVTFNLS